GANRLARSIAGGLGGRAAVTTASDSRFGFGLDDPPPGWRLANPQAAKGVAAALLAGGPVALRVEAGNASWLEGSGAPFADQGETAVRITDRDCQGSDGELVLHPPTLALGVGCERGAGPEELISLAEEAITGAGLSPFSVACVVSLDLKSDEEAVHALAARLGVPARFFDAKELEAMKDRLANPSSQVFKAVGCHGVAEGAALAAAGPDGELIVPKKTSKRATSAIARSRCDIDCSNTGRMRGKLTVVGIGPGSSEWRTPEAARTLSEATDVVGYGLYMDLIADLVEGKALHESKMTQEEKRARKALELAAQGRNVALVSSGDAGIYALASLVFELLDREDRAEWNRLEVSINPGISALQAAAARAGAPMGHDFCAISLSDLLTPFEEIERRLRAAAESDFVIALYNPVSKRRRTQLAAACEILLKSRPADTPVVIARNLGRDGESVKFIPLGELTPDHADMRTIILIGSSRTRLIERGGRGWVYTPRGYESKMDRKKTRKASS
ncbi:MAG: precorrin-3B C(17)-methyltransferase, partial [Rhodospirillales bacterium]